ncbi:Clp protease N-terminal domain-containing protein [Streptacidiphilus neutrinimicus]|uniref:Clp protease N-terminal domain-containing protein n=1 Tax=Streptacidiphilus neutrinimicus TaxID=105420 RepID=UPI000694F146|nr:Clp protease N-terminal domain-containing protein [Streptacidiphilus neutrinimicus]
MRPEPLRVAATSAFAHREEPALVGALAVVVARARRRALRAGDPEVDTGHLLHALLETDESALGVAAPLPMQATRLMGYLVQRSIGFGRLWRFGEGVADRERERSAGLAWSATAAGALGRAARGGGSVLDLLRELATVPDSRAAEILRGAGIDPSAVVQRSSAQGAEHTGGW